MVVSGPNDVDFRGHLAGANPRRFSSLSLVQSRLAEEEAAQATEERDPFMSRGGQIWVYGDVGQFPVATRPDAACYHCVDQYQDDVFALYTTCGDICEVADCVADCEEEYSAGAHGPTVPAFVSQTCMHDCHV